MLIATGDKIPRHHLGFALRLCLDHTRRPADHSPAQSRAPCCVSVILSVQALPYYQPIHKRSSSDPRFLNPDHNPDPDFKTDSSQLLPLLASCNIIQYEQDNTATDSCPKTSITKTFKMYYRVKHRQHTM